MLLSNLKKPYVKKYWPSFFIKEITTYRGVRENAESWIFRDFVCKNCEWFFFRFLFPVSFKPRRVEQCLGEVSFSLFINGSRSDRWKWDCHKVTSNNCGISFRQKILYLEDMLQDNHELQHLLETTFYLFRQEEGETLLYLSLFQILLSLRDQEYSLLPCKDIFRMLVSMQDHMFLGLRLNRHNECPVMLGNETCLLFQTAMDFCTIHIRV